MSFHTIIKGYPKMKWRDSAEFQDEVQQRGMEKTRLFCFMILMGCFFTVRIKATESPQYTVMHTESDFEVRFYRESVWMSAPTDEISFEKATKDGFHRYSQFLIHLFFTVLAYSIFRIFIFWGEIIFLPLRKTGQIHVGFPS